MKRKHRDDAPREQLYFAFYFLKSAASEILFYLPAEQKADHPGITNTCHFTYCSISPLFFLPPVLDSIEFLVKTQIPWPPIPALAESSPLAWGLEPVF